MKTLRSLLILSGLLAGCSQAPQTVPEPESSPDTAKVEAVLNATPQADLLQKISAAKTSVKQGDVLTLEGKIMGSEHPFVDGRAAFTMGDPEVLVSCDLMAGDTCETPWDNCCDDPKLIRAQTVLVQIVDEQGIVLRAPVKGVQGISELSQVRVTGTVDADPMNEVLILNATAMDVL